MFHDLSPGDLVQVPFEGGMTHKMGIVVHTRDFGGEPSNYFAQILFELGGEFQVLPLFFREIELVQRRRGSRRDGENGARAKK
jgi:hypothetical protein